MHLTLQIVGKTLFNADVGDDADRIGAALNTMVELFNFLLLPFSEWLEKLPLPHSMRFNKARQDAGRDHLWNYRRTPAIGQGRGRPAVDAA